MKPIHYMGMFNLIVGAVILSMLLGGSYQSADWVGIVLGLANITFGAYILAKAIKQ